MKNKLFLPAMIVIILSSCDSMRAKETTKDEPPKALQDKTIRSISSDVSYKRGGTDMVDALYSDLVDANPGLKKLETEIDDLATSKKYSTESFDNFNEKNADYYSSAGLSAGAVKDSVLRAKLKALIATSSAKYGALVLQHDEILKTVQSKTASLNDLHLALKIIRTLPVIEKFQKDQSPSASPEKAYQLKVEQTIKHTENLLEQ